jgi:hypothetical protein
MTPEGQFSVDGVRSDGVGHYQLNAEQWALFDDAREAYRVSAHRHLLTRPTRTNTFTLQRSTVPATTNTPIQQPTNVVEISDQSNALANHRRPLVCTNNQTHCAISGYAQEQRNAIALPLAVA